MRANYFAVTRRRGPSSASGFISLGGPLGAGESILLVTVAATEAEVRARLDVDPWTPLRLLEVATIEPWTILLDGR